VWNTIYPSVDHSAPRPTLPELSRTKYAASPRWTVDEAQLPPIGYTTVHARPDVLSGLTCDVYAALNPGG
jgi:hypothetical protein